MWKNTRARMAPPTPMKRRTGDEKTGHGYKLVACAMDLRALQEAVHELHGSVRGRAREAVVVTQLRDPVHKQPP